MVRCIRRLEEAANFEKLLMGVEVKTNMPAHVFGRLPFVTGPDENSLAIDGFHPQTVRRGPNFRDGTAFTVVTAVLRVP